VIFRALAIDEARYGKDHPRVAADLNNLAGLLHVTNRILCCRKLPSVSTHNSICRQPAAH
jgi:hypothetical protein